MTENNQIREIIKQLRNSYEAMTNTEHNDPIYSIQRKNLTLSNGDKTEIDIYTPYSYMPEKNKVIIFVHGGGWVSGSLNTHQTLIRRLALDNSAIVVAIGYHIAPEYKFPYQINEIIDVLHWITDHIHTYKGDKNSIFIAGDSAGGNITASLTTLLAKENNKNFNILGQILYYPVLATEFVDSESTRLYGQGDYFPDIKLNEIFRNEYFGSLENMKSDIASPIKNPPANLVPTLIINAGKDILRDEGKCYYDKLVALGVDAKYKVYPEMQHGFIQFFKEPENIENGYNALELTKNFISNIYIKK